MTDITIPPEAVEAATNAVHEFFHNTHSWAFSHELALAALRAGIAAWPGASGELSDKGNPHLILPLPKEET